MAKAFFTNANLFVEFHSVFLLEVERRFSSSEHYHIIWETLKSGTVCIPIYFNKSVTLSLSADELKVLGFRIFTFTTIFTAKKIEFEKLVFLDSRP
jgi:hypothetical protein